MKYIILTFLFFGLIGCSHSSKKDSIKPPEFKEYTLQNGLKVIFAENKKLPLVSATLMIYPGSTADPKSKTGLTYLMSELIAKGTRTKSADEVADAFAQIGTTFSESVKNDYMYFSAESLAQNQERLIELFSEVVTQPAFSSKEFSMLKKRMMASIQKSYDEPSFVINYVFDKTLMGDYVYSNPTSGTLKDVSQIKLSDVKSQYQNLFNTKQAILVLTGDWDQSVLKDIENYFSIWKATDRPALKIATSTVFPEVKEELLLVTKPDLKQAQIKIGHKGIKRNNQDYWSIQVANVILGGNFSSRLMNEVRVKRGLTYTINSRFDPGLFEGPYSISTFTRFDKIKETIQTTKSVLSEFKDKGVSKDEVLRAKNYLKGHLIRSFENPEDLVMTLLRMRIYGLPAEEVTQVIQKVDSVSQSTVNESIKKYFASESFKTVIYAPESMKAEVKDLGDLKIKKASDYF